MPLLHNVCLNIYRKPNKTGQYHKSKGVNHTISIVYVIDVILQLDAGSLVIIIITVIRLKTTGMMMTTSMLQVCYSNTKTKIFIK